MIDKTLDASETIVRAFQEDNILIFLVAIIIILIGLVSSLCIIFAKFVINQKQKDSDSFEKKYNEKLTQYNNSCSEKNQKIKELEINYQSLLQNFISISSNHNNFINSNDKEIVRTNARMTVIENKIEDIAEKQVDHNEAQIRAIGEVNRTIASLITTSQDVRITSRSQPTRNGKKID